MAITLTVNAVDKSNQVEWNSISIEQVLTKEPDILTFKIKNYGTKTYRPLLGETVEVFNGATKIFSGVVVELTEDVDGLAKFLKVLCKDHSFTLDSILVNKAYTNQTINAIIANLITTFAPSFTYVNVNAPFVVGKVVFNYLSISNCLAKLTKLAGDYDWFVDYDKDIHFFVQSTIPAPFSLTDTNGNYLWNSLTIHTEIHQLKNDIIVRGGDVPSATPRTEVFDGDGVKLSFSLASRFENTPTVLVNTIPQTVGIDFVSPEASFNCFWNQNEKYIRFKVSTVPSAGTNNVTVSGTPLFPLIVQKSNQTSIIDWGHFQGLITDKTLKELNTAEDRADTELSLYSEEINTGYFETYKDGLKVGQVLNVQSTIRGLNKDYKIQAITTTLHTLDSLIHSVELVASEDLGINDVLQKLLIKDPSDLITVQEDEVVQRFTQFNESFEITDSFSVVNVTNPPYYWAVSGINDLIWTFGTWS